MTRRLRFAPAPSGFLHVGNARAALVNRLLADHLLLRFDDTALRFGDTALRFGDTALRLGDTAAPSDPQTEQYISAARDDLAWIGVEPDAEARQSQRGDVHRALAERLLAAERLYPCYETPQELDAMRAAAKKRRRPFRYDRSARRLTQQQRAELEEQGRKPHWRFLLDDTLVVFQDLVRGEVRLSPRRMSDPVLLREDRSPLYQLSSVADDLDLGITHVVRGEDLLSAVVVHVQIARAVDAAADVPVFCHLPLITLPDGSPLSKRRAQTLPDGSPLSKRRSQGEADALAPDLTLRGLRANGIQPEPLRSALLSLGTGAAPQLDPPPSLDLSSVSSLGRAPARLDPSSLYRLNTRFIRSLSHENAAQRMNFPSLRADVWDALKDECADLTEARNLILLLEKDPPPSSFSPEEAVALFGAVALASELPDDLSSPDSARPWINNVAKRVERNGRALYAPLRRALIGRDHGPALSLLLSLIGAERSRRRLVGALQHAASKGASNQKTPQTSSS